MTHEEHVFRFVFFLTLAWVLSCAPVVAQELASDQLLIRGAVLQVSPATQEIDPGRPTVVNTALGQLAPGEIPSGLRVVGELSGPGLDEPISLSTVPGEPFLIPGLSREGTYTLGGLRLTSGEDILATAQPDSVQIIVHRLVITSVTSRPLTPDEMEEAGIVIGDDNYTAWRYTVGFQLESGTVDVPFTILSGPKGTTLLPPQSPYKLPSPSSPPVPTLPQIQPVSIEIPGFTGLPPQDDPNENGGGGGSIPGFLIIPSDVSFLNQFFSAILVVQNGALEGSGIELRNLNAVLELDDDGLRQASTEPPTVPGESVPVVDPGPDGELGTSDDLTFIVAQSAGRSSWSIEGLKEGQHLISVHLTGELHGLASGKPAPFESTVPGVVVVRDPRFALTFLHPWTVRAGEDYRFEVVIANTSTTPVYDLHMSLPENELSGVQLFGDAEVTVDELDPGDSAKVGWDLRSLRTGRVVASAFNSSSPIDASFRFHVGVGELGIPLSPDSLVLPDDVHDLPTEVVEPALQLLGLAHSLANAPPGAEIDLPPVSEGIVMRRGQELAAAARRAAFGEDQDRCLVDMGLRWIGSATWDTGFDALRRSSSRGHQLETALARALARRMDAIGADAALAEVEEMAITGRPLLLVTARGAGYSRTARLILSGTTSQLGAAGQAADTDIFTRDLPGAAVLDVNPTSAGFQGEVGLVAVPVDADGNWVEESYQVQLHGLQDGSIDLAVVLVMPDGSTRRYSPAPIVLGRGGLAFLTVGPALDSVEVLIDSNGDGVQDSSESVDVVTGNRPAPRLLRAVFDDTLQPPSRAAYRKVLLLFSQIVDNDAVRSLDLTPWSIQSHVELPPDDPTLVVDRPRAVEQLIQQIDPHFLVLIATSQLNPHAQLILSTGGEEIPFIGGGALQLDAEPVSHGGDLQSGAVRGVVVGGDGRPVPGALVELYESVRTEEFGGYTKWPLMRSDSVTADSAGRFTLDAVRYRDGQVPTENAAFLIRVKDPSSGHEARLFARLAADGAVRDLTVTMVGRGDVIGTLSRDDGTPLIDPAIQARSVTNPEEYAVGTIAADGSFILSDLPVGPLQIAARDGSAFAYATATIPGPGDQAQVDIILPVVSPQPTGDVDGTVISGDTGDPVPGIQVYVVPDSAGGPVAVAATGSDGTFSMSSIPAGPVWFKAWDPARKLYVGEKWADILADTTNNVQIVAMPPATGSVEGTVYHQISGSRVPAEGVWVVAHAAGRYAITDDQGAYRLDELPLGSVQLSASDPATGEGAARNVTLTTQGQLLTVDFDLGQASGSIQGTVVDRDGNPLGGVHVAENRFGAGHETVSLGDGTFILNGLAPGNHAVLARLGNRLGRSSASILYNGDVGQTTIVLGGLVSMEIRTVADTQGGGTADVLSQLEFRKPGITSTGKIGSLPEEGWYPCIQGDPSADCYIDDQGHGHISYLPEGVGALTVRATNGFYGQMTKSEDLDPSDDGQTLTINFSAPGSIAGRVLSEENGQLVPVEGASVQLWVTNDWGGMVAQQIITTGADGTYFFELVNHGGFRLDVAGPDGSNEAGWIGGYIASAQAITGLDIVLRKAGSVSGHVAVCTGGNAPSSPGDMVHLELSPVGPPSPFQIIDGDPPQEMTPVALQRRTLDLDLSTGDSFSFSNLLSGTWSLHATNPLHGSAWLTVSIPADGSQLVLTDPICLHPTGAISGTVVWPETGDPVPNATVQLFDGRSVLTADTTGADGGFVFNDLPVGHLYAVAASDPASNRGGISPAMKLCDATDPGFGNTCFQTYQIQLPLQPLGTVEGVVRTADGDPVPNAFVRLRTNIVRNSGGTIVSSSRELLAYSGADGAYSFDGIPAGNTQLEAFDPDSPLFVTWSGAIDPLTDPVTTVDLDLPPTADLTVRVLDPTGQPLPEGSQPVVAFRQQSEHFREPQGGVSTVEHLVQGSPMTFSGVVDGRIEAGSCFGTCAGMTVRSVLDHHLTADLGAHSTFTMPDPPASQVLDLQLVARAGIQVTVLDGNGDPAEGAEVTVSGTGFYGGVNLVSQTDSSGQAGPFDGLGVGSYTVAATLTDTSGNTIRGVSQVEIAQADHGQTVPVEVSLEAAGSAHGLVIDAEGAPAPAALVSMSYWEGSTQRLFQTVTDNAGAFSFPALPSGHEYELHIAEGNGGWGLYSASGIAVAQAPVDLGTLRLDNSNPRIANVDPANGASQVPQDQPVVLDFSELMRHESLTSGRLVLRHGGQTVAINPTIEDMPDPDGDGPLGPFTRVTLDHAPLASDTLYLVDVFQGVEDLGGRTLAVDYHATFQTADTVPPHVTLVAPADDPSGTSPVGPDVEPVITFSEIVDPASINENTVRLLDANGTEATVQRVLVGDGFAVELRPDTGLALDSFYTLSVSGVTDTSGNPMNDAFTSTFRVRDAEPPVATLLPPDGANVSGDTWTATEGLHLILRAAISSNDALASVAFSVDGTPLPGSPALDQASGEYRQAWTVPQGVGQHTLAVQAVDVSGNLSPTADHILVVTDDAPPSGTLSADPAAEILPNHLLQLTVNAQDDRGLAAAHFTLTGAIAATRDISFPQGATGQIVTSFRLAADAAAGTQVVVNCTLEDTLGQTTPLTPVTVTVLGDTEPPVVTTLSPAPGATVTSGDTLSLSFHLADNVGYDTVTLTVDGQPENVQLTNVVDPGTEWSADATASWQAPEVTQPTDTPYTLSVTDPAGHTTEATGTFTVEPLINPDAPVVTIGCPADGDPVLAGIQTTVSFHITDDEQIQDYSILINGSPTVSNVAVDNAELDTTYDWIPPADANPGDTFTIRIEASDFAGNIGFDQITLTVPGGTVLSGDQILDTAHAGENLILGPGTYTIDATLDALTPASLTLIQGATLQTTALHPLSVNTSGQVHVACGAILDASGSGYAGGTTAHRPGYAPDGVLGSDPNAGGSHGGLGAQGVQSGATGEAYGSVYAPGYGGGGGALWESGGTTGYAGGGIVVLNAGQLVLNGEIRALGSYSNGNWASPGAGGAVIVEAGELSGSGSIDASGGGSANSGEGAGGGGRVALNVGSFAGFDPGQQVLVQGGARQSSSPIAFGGAGTLYIKTSGSTNGDLIVDQGGANGKPVALTPLPSLGQGTLGTVTDDGSDAWITPADGDPDFDLGAVGMWVRIGGTDYRVAAQQDRRTILLEGAAGQLSSGQTYQGVYKFDSVTVHGGADVVFGDPAEVGSTDVDADSELWDFNGEGPTVDNVNVGIDGSNYVVTGGTVTDPDGISSVTLHNVASDATWPVSLNADGSFAPVVVDGNPGDVIELIAVDAHPYPRQVTVQIGTLPANGTPVIDTEMISFSVDGSQQYHMLGAAGAVTDDTPPLTVTVTDKVSGDTWTAQAASDGSFDVPIAAAFGEALTLSVTDSAPEPQTTTVDVGSRPDLVPPVLDLAKVHSSAHDRSFWVYAPAGGVVDSDGVTEAHLEDPAQPGVTWTVTVQSDGSFPEAAVSAAVGAVLTLSVTDVGGNTTTAQIQPLPANSGPPVIDTSFVTTDAAVVYTVGSRQVDCTWSCSGILMSADGLENVHLEDRTTPGFGPWPVTPVLAPGSGGYYAFDPVTIDGAVGDEIWLVAEDGHPVWQSAEANVWSLPQITDAPAVNVDATDIQTNGAAYQLLIPAGAVTDPNGPLTLNAAVWSQTNGTWSLVGSADAQLASGEAGTIALPSAAPGDLVLLSVTDTDSDGPRKTTIRVGTVPAPVLPQVSFTSQGFAGNEDAGDVVISVKLSETSAAPVTVAYNATGETADAGQDFVAASGTLTFAPGETERTFTVTLIDDTVSESTESIHLELSSPSGAIIGAPATARLLIADNDPGAATSVTFSVDANGSVMYNGALGVSITGGWASFTSNLPAREGDRITYAGGFAFVQECASPTLCRVVAGNGQAPPDVASDTITEVRPAFSSLADAVSLAGDADHLGTFDLTAAGTSLKLLCYFRGASDTDPVLIDGWTTSPDHGIHIVAHNRHSGSWYPGTYNISVDGSTCLTSTVGNLHIEGLQLHCSGAPVSDIDGILLTGPAVTGNVEIGETIIRLDDADGPGKRVGIETETVGAVQVHVRNSIVYDLGSGSDAHTGILAASDGLTMDVASTTVYGGEYGVRQTAGAIVARNVLATDALTACFDGAFLASSRNNLSSDDTAPGLGSVTAASAIFAAVPGGGPPADLHLVCAPDALATAVTSSPLDTGSIANVFDGDPWQVARTAAVNPGFVQLVFDTPMPITGTAVAVANGEYRWMLAGADTTADMESQTGSYQVIVPWQETHTNGLPDPGVRWSEPSSPIDATARVVRLTVEKLGGDDYVHIAEWRLDGLNPGCGAGMDLSSDPQDPFTVDVDSIQRIRPWDIGADQATPLTLGFAPSSQQVWEEEGHAVLPVRLSRPAANELSLHYTTLQTGTAEPGADFTPVSGTLIVPAGLAEATVQIPIVDDGIDDDGETFQVRLDQPATVLLDPATADVEIHDGAAPPRVTFTGAPFTVAEADGTVQVPIQLSHAGTDPVTVWWQADDGTAQVGLDYAGAHGGLVIAPGETTGVIEVPILDDTVSEGDETFFLTLLSADNGVLGATRATVTITDDDPPAVDFAIATAMVPESGGAIVVPVTLSGPSGQPVTVDYATSDGTAQAGMDYGAVSGSLTFAPGETLQGIVVPILEDTVLEDNETFTVTLANPAGASLGGTVATEVTIEDNDAQATIDPGLFDLDLSGCSPVLAAQTNAVTSDGSSISVSVTVDNPDPAADWSSSAIQIASGDPFSFELQQVEPGATLLVNAQLSGGNPNTQPVASVPNAPPTVDVRWVTVDGYGDVSIPGAAITDRLNTVSLTVEDPSQSLSETVSGPCPGTSGTANIGGNPGDQLTLTACNGSVVPVCTNPMSIGRIPSDEVVPMDLGPAGVTGLSREGPTILVTTDQNEHRMVALNVPDPWNPNIYPWHIPSPFGAMGTVTDRGDWGLSWVEGSHVLGWDDGNGLWADSEPLGTDVNIDGVLRQGDHVFFTGHDASGSYLTAAVENGSDGRLVCSPGNILTLNVSQGVTPLALIPLPGPYVGVVTSSSAMSEQVLVVDISDPSNPVQSTTRSVTFDGLSGALTRADVEDDFLAVWTADGHVDLYYLMSDGLWPDGQAVLTLGQAEMFSPPAGRTIRCVTRAGFNYPLAGLDDGTVADSQGNVVIILPEGPVTGLTEVYDMIFMGTPGGLYSFDMTNGLGDGFAELHRTRVRRNGTRIHFAAGAITFPSDGAYLEVNGDGTDANGDPVSVTMTVDAPDAWQPLDVDLPSSYDGATNITWSDVDAYDNFAGDGDYLYVDSTDLNSGPAFFDPHCEAGTHSCAADLAAAGTGWRALAKTGDGRLRVRWSKGDPWAWYDISLNNVRQLTAGITMPDRLFVSGDVFSLVILTDPGNPLAPLSVDPFVGPSGTAYPVSADYVVVAADDNLQVAVIGLQDPYNPVIATAATTLADGAGRVTDMYLDSANRLWILTNNPDRLIELDAAQLPSIQVLGSWDLPDDGGGARVALDGGTFHYAPANVDLESLWIVRRGQGLDLYDRANIGSGVLDSIALPGDPRDVWIGECATGIRVLVAAGFDAGVLQVDTSGGGASGQWPVSWVGDLGDVRRLTLAAQAFYGGNPVPESCSDIRDFRENSPIPDPCGARLYGLSEAGVLAVPVDICTCGGN